MDGGGRRCDGRYATDSGAAPDPQAKGHRDALSAAIAPVEGQGLARPWVPSIDRAGDAAGHLRRWLVHVKDHPRLDDGGRPMACKAVGKG